MAQRSVVCPSGLAGTVRGLKGKEMKLLSDRQKARSGELFDELLGACWVETSDPGPYRLSDKGHPNWLDVLSGDRFYALIQLRVATYPNEDYGFTVRCQNDICGESFPWDVPLQQLPLRKLSPDSLARFKEGRPFETTMGGKRVQFSLSTGRHERKGLRFARGQAVDVMRVLQQRITDVEGVDVKDRLAWLEDLELSEHRDLLDKFGEVDCGVETEIEVQCTACGTVQAIDLPFGAEFFMPRKQARRRRAAAK